MHTCVCVCVCVCICLLCMYVCLIVHVFVLSVCTFVHVISLTHMGLTCRESEGNGLSREMAGDSSSTCTSDEANVMTSSHCTAR